jgi:signal transduction histidine kinase
MANTDLYLVPGTGRLAASLNVAGLALLVWGVTSEADTGLGGHRLAVIVLLVAAVGAWITWLLARARGAEAMTLASLAVMATAGGALGAFAPVALVFVGVASLGATFIWKRPWTALIVGAGPVALAVSLPASGRGAALIGSGVAAALAGVLIGVSRRASQERVTRAAVVEVTQARADAEAARAELLAGRNHLARELHDVLAHTLSALALQLEAFDSVLSAEREPGPGVREQLDGTKRLVREGLDEARGAVRALREDAAPLDEQLAKLAADRGASFTLEGDRRSLPAEVTLALYRVAQEALTNRLKHAPGSTAEVALAFCEDEVRLTVANGPAGSGQDPHAVTLAGLSDSGLGYGLQGIRERVLLLGGTVAAGPAGGGWAVKATVPV